MKRNTLKKMMINGILAAAALHAEPAISPEVLQNLRQSMGLHTSANFIGAENGDQVRRGFDASRMAARAGNQPQAFSSSSSVVIPLVLNGFEGSAAVVSVFNIVNMSNTPARVSLEFFDASGSRVAMPTANDEGNLAGISELVYGTFQEKEFGSLLTYPSGSLKAAYARLESFPAGAVQVQFQRAYVKDGLRVVTPGQAATSYESDVVYSLPNDPNLSCKFSLVNTENLPLTATVRSRSNAGAELCRVNKTVYASEAVMLTPGAESTCMAGLKGKAHTIEISTDRPGLNVDNYALTLNWFQSSLAFSNPAAQ
ncbi:MAG: hypothetical protein Q8N47_26005 [Bryobacterales bacterium]|nr:hypothetical protein [Bryobacterales bacterium]